MSDTPEYRRKYENPQVDEAYRLFVDGKGSQREIATLTGVARRTLQRRSAADKWLEEQTERAKERAHGATMAALAPNPGAGGACPDLEDRIRSLMSSDDVRSRVGAVMSHQRIFWNLLSNDLSVAYADLLATAKKNGRRLSAGALFPFVALGEKIAQQQRKAHGIPDVTKLELEDKSAARMHADTIRDRRAKRLAEKAAAEKAAIEKSQPPQEHGPN